MLISRTRQARVAGRRAEWTSRSGFSQSTITRLVERSEAAAEHLVVAGGRAVDLEELKQDVESDQVLHSLDAANDRPAAS